MTKALPYLILIISLGIFACNSSHPPCDSVNNNDSKSKNSTKTISDKIDTPEPNRTSDSIGFFEVDDYPVNNEKLKDKYFEISSGKSKSYDKAWFRNESTHQVLVFELYTDYHRFVTYCFDYKNIPIELIERFHLNIEGGNLASTDQKQKDLNGFIKKSTNIDMSNFVSNKGVSIGISKEYAIQLYGEPSKINSNRKLEILEWKFSGDMEDKPETNRIAKDSFGHTVTMFFENDKLIAQILFNDIP